MENGARYGVVLTTGGGFYRYRLGDTVEAVGRIHHSPLLRFVGRETAVSDRVGEKLHTSHVARALSDSVLGGFAMLAPDDNAQPVRYVLFSDAPTTVLPDVARRLDDALHANVHYALARRLGQLGP